MYIKTDSIAGGNTCWNTEIRSNYARNTYPGKITNKFHAMVSGN